MNLLLNGPKGSFVIVDYVILVLAVLSNGLCLQGIIRAKFNLAGYRRFLISLVISELYVCAVNLALFMFEILTWYMPTSFGNHCESHVLRSFQLVGFFANLLNLLGMTVDHFIGIVYPLKYRSLMSTSVARTAVFIIWVASVLLGFADMPVATVKYFSQKTTANSKPAVCSGNVISDIVDILESSDFLTANSQLLFNNNEADRLKQAANAAALANSFFSRRSNSTGGGGSAFANGTSGTPGDYGYNNYNYGNRDMTDPEMYPFLFLAQSENYNYNEEKVLRDTRSANKIRKNRTRSSGVMPNNTSIRRAMTASLLKTPTTILPTVYENRKLVTFPSEFRPELTLRSNLTVNGVTDVFPTELPMTTPPRRINQSPENEVALCEALIKAQTKMDDHGWCSQYGSDPWLEVCIMSLTVVCFCFFTFCYGKIFRLVFVEAEFKRRKTRKMVVTTCLLLSTFAICYLPFMLYEFFMMWYDDAAQVQSSTTFLLIHNVFNSLLLSYPLFDPIIFVARSPPVLRNIIDQFSCLLPCCPSFIKARLHSLSSSSTKYSSEVSRAGPGRNSYRLSARSNSAATFNYSSETSYNDVSAGKSVETLFSRTKRQPTRPFTKNNKNSNSALLLPPSSNFNCNNNNNNNTSFITEVSPNGLANNGGTKNVMIGDGNNHETIPINIDSSINANNNNNASTEYRVVYLLGQAEDGDC